MIKYQKILTVVFFTAAILLFLTVLVLDQRKEKVERTYQEFWASVEQGMVERVILSDASKMEFTLKDDATMYITENPRNLALKEKLLLEGVSVEESDHVTVGSLVQTGLSILFFGGAFYFVYRSMSRQNAKSAMALEVSEVCGSDESRVTFRDIAGNEEAKESVQELVDFIQNPDKYARYGARAPHGILFYGPPGTGKTLLAKAIAGEAGVAFYAVSGSDFVQMYVGVGASRIRDLFKKARANQKAVIFIDEIDALGKKRSSHSSGGNDERDQTLNALLTEMSGFDNSGGIVVIAATNRLDTLDEALLRPGRFDRQIEIGLPDLNARKKIISHHIGTKPFASDINIHNLAKETVYFSGAMLENLINESAIAAAKAGTDEIRQQHLEQAYTTIIAGSEKKDRSQIRPIDRKITAYHEAGHALAAKMKLPQNKVAKVSIIPSTKGAGGYCVNIPQDQFFYTKKELESQIMVSLGGRAAEEIIFGAESITTGASNDIQKATGVVRELVGKYGMSGRMGLLDLQMFQEKDMLDECREIMEGLYQETKELIYKHLDALHRIAQALLDQEVLDEVGLEQAIQGTPDKKTA